MKQSPNTINDRVSKGLQAIAQVKMEVFSGTDDKIVAINLLKQ
jgi:hypothetical protein